MKEQETRHDRLALRLSVIISRLMAGESLALRPLSEEFGVSLRPLQRDIQQRLLHLDIQHDGRCYRLRTNPLRDNLHRVFSFIPNTGIAKLLPGHNRHLLQLLTAESGIPPCIIGHAPLKSHDALSTFFCSLAQAISGQRCISLQADGREYSGLEPYRLIHSGEAWYLVACHSGSLCVFDLTTISAVSLSGEGYTHREEIIRLTTDDDFISSLPSFALTVSVLRRVSPLHISNVHASPGEHGTSSYAP